MTHNEAKSETILTNESGFREDENALWRQLAEGFLYTHSRLSENTKSTLEVSSFIYGLIELLAEKGLISVGEVDSRMHEANKRLRKKNEQKRVGVLVQEPEYEKYDFDDQVEIDCENRTHLCKAACCRLPFALSKQDVREGIVHWDFGQPYLIAQTAQGCCTHLDSELCQCTVHEHRPVPCRGFDCRKDNKIWLDFDNMVINPRIHERDWPHCISGGEEAGTAT